MSAILESRADARSRIRPALVRTHAAFWLAVLAFALYLPPAARVVQLSPDTVEYVDVARRLNAGEGYRLGVKAYHFGGTDVLHDGLAERAPLYPLLAAALLRLGVGLAGLQVFNAVLAGVCVALVCAIATVLFGRRTGVLAGLLAAASPVMLVRMVPPMSEALAISLTLLAIWLVIRRFECSGTRPFLAAGAALGLAYLARPTTGVTVALLVLGLLVASRDRRALVRPLAALLAGVAVFAAPISLYSLITRGSFSYSGQMYLYAVFKDADVLRNGYGRPIPSVAEFLSANANFVVAAIIENLGDYGRLVFLDPDWLLFLLPAWPVALLALARGRYPRATWPVLLVAAGNFVFYGFTWANYQERYQLPTLLLLIPFAVDGLSRLGLGRAFAVAGIPVVPIYGVVVGILVLWSSTFIREYRGEFTYGDEPTRARTDQGIRWTGPPRWVQDNDLSRMIEWINLRTERNDVLAHGQPWPFTFFTGRPATLLPTKLTGERLRAFVSDYRVAYVLLDTRDRDRRDYQVDLDALASVGVLANTVGSYRVYDTRALWR